MQTLNLGQSLEREVEQCGATNFSGKQTSKKKRKSRTAFTNMQIVELERRFRNQQYLSPADRDEIATTLHLTNAQVITWFQNRRAKQKRDQEEKKRDIETAKMLTMHHTFLESFRVIAQFNSAMQGSNL